MLASAFCMSVLNIPGHRCMTSLGCRWGKRRRCEIERRTGAGMPVAGCAVFCCSQMEIKKAIEGVQPATLARPWRARSEAAPAEETLRPFTRSRRCKVSRLHENKVWRRTLVERRAPSMSLTAPALTQRVCFRQDGSQCRLRGQIARCLSRTHAKECPPFCGQCLCSPCTLHSRQSGSSSRRIGI